MEWGLMAVILFAGLILILVMGIPVTFSLSLVSAVWMLFLWGPDGWSTLATTAFSANVQYMLTAIPLFVFMGECIAVTGMGKDAFRMIDSWLGFLPGGIAVTSVGACTIFGAITGFSPASIAAIGPITIPEMLRRGYDKGFAVGALASAAGIAIIIPPSILMVIYGFLAEVSIGRLFYGGVIPGLILSGVIIGSIILRAIHNPKLAPYRHKSSWAERFRLSIYISPFVVLMGLVLGTIWGGIATPTEAAALGAAAGFGLLWVYRRIDWETVKGILLSSVNVTCMVMFIFIGATLFTQVLSYTGITGSLAEWTVGLGVSRWVIQFIMQACIFFLGCLMDAGSIMFITLPIFLPIVKKLDFDLLWFGIVVLMNLEIATITPPVGLNLYVMKGIAPPGVTFSDIIWGCAPYWVINTVALLIVAFFPITATWLPNLLMD